MTASEVGKKYRNDLAEKPWLRSFIDDGDDDLEPAKARWREAQAEARIALRHKGVELHRTMTTANGLRTTALLVKNEGEER
jgi:hypothetical protein